MRLSTFLIPLMVVPIAIFGQRYNNDLQSEVSVPKHYFSVNPLNILVFQQVGISYEYKPGILGYGVTTGYIYPNKQEYSNFFYRRANKLRVTGMVFGILCGSTIECLPQATKTFGLRRDGLSFS